MLQEEQKQLYSQKTIGIATFFGGPLAAGVLVRRNYINLGNDHWEAVGGLYGKRNKKLVDKLEYFNPATPTEISTTQLTYTFDDENRPLTITRTGNGFTEVYTYEYYEDEE